MKKTILSIMCALLALAGYAQSERYLNVVKKDGFVIEVAVGSIDSIFFSTKTEVLELNGHEYVDLGLPSGTLWATTNVGAKKSSDYGDYFAWGETSTKTNYIKDTYKWYEGGYTKYCTNKQYGIVDNITTLDLEDDAAHVNWGGSWRMPTQREFQELVDNCTWTWTKLNGVDGYKVSSKVEDSEAYIFLPAAGYRQVLGVLNEGTGYYWSASLNVNSSEGAWRLQLTSGGSHDTRHDTYYRYYGFPVRPVCSSL